MNILDTIFKERLEARRGRIFFASGNWVFDPTPAQLARSYYVHESEDATGRKMYCIKQRGAWCRNPEAGDGFPKSTEHETWFVPAYVCRKCKHHRKGRRRGTPRYPTCQWVADKNTKQTTEHATKPTAEQLALGDTLDVWDEARKWADEMIG